MKKEAPLTPLEGGGFRVNIRLRLASGEVVRERHRKRELGRTAAERWRNDRISHLLKFGKEKPEAIAPPAAAEMPTLAVFAEEFVKNYATTNNKASEVASKKSVLEIHLTPAFGKLRLDEIGTREIEAFKSAQLADGYAPKTINNQLTILGKLLRTAVSWKVLGAAPEIQWLKVEKPGFDFLTFEEAPRLVAGADSWWGTMMLVALRTGLRIGELRALRWEDVDLVAGRLMVRRAAWKNKVGTPKSGKTREIPLSPDATSALQKHRHLIGPLVFCHEAGAMLTENGIKHPIWRAARRAGLRQVGWHVLRHTFASHLAMHGVPLKAIQELMGHATLEVTMRYAHLAPEARIEAVSKLDGVSPYKTVAQGGHKEARAK